ncbi:MAG: hypothetical protein K9I34_06990 [Bacteroidales bacterium]|nr:hypothetical protein [Bacteroidales bacterium]
MKKLFLTFLLGMMLIPFSALYAQDLTVFSGTIEYTMTVVGGDLSAAERAQAESEIALTIGNGGFLKKKTTNIMANSTEIIMPDSAIIIFEQMGQLMAFGLGKEFVQKTDSSLEAAWASMKDSITYDYLSESKMVGGQNCKKAVYTINGEYFDVFYLDKYILPANASDVQLRGLKGLPLEYAIPLPGYEGATVNVTAKTFKYKKKVKETEFKAPAGVEVKPGEELLKMMGM